MQHLFLAISIIFSVQNFSERMSRHQTPSSYTIFLESLVKIKSTKKVFYFPSFFQAFFHFARFFLLKFFNILQFVLFMLSHFSKCDFLSFLAAASVVNVTQFSYDTFVLMTLNIEQQFQHRNWKILRDKIKQRTVVELQ